MRAATPAFQAETAGEKLSKIAEKGQIWFTDGAYNLQSTEARQD